MTVSFSGQFLGIVTIMPLIFCFTVGHASAEDAMAEHEIYRKQVSDSISLIATERPSGKSGEDSGDLYGVVGPSSETRTYKISKASAENSYVLWERTVPHVLTVQDAGRSRIQLDLLFFDICLVEGEVRLIYGYFGKLWCEECKDRVTIHLWGISGIDYGLGVHPVDATFCELQGRKCVWVGLSDCTFEVWMWNLDRFEKTTIEKEANAVYAAAMDTKQDEIISNPDAERHSGTKTHVFHWRGYISKYDLRTDEPGNSVSIESVAFILLGALFTGAAGAILFYKIRKVLSHAGTKQTGSGFVR